MRAANEHLSTEEIEELTGPAADVAGGALEGAMRHLDRCDQCRLRLLISRDEDEAEDGGLLAGGGSPPQSQSGSACPDEERWLELAAGAMLQAERLRHLEHAALCGKCGPLLKAAIEDVGMELTPEEEAKVASLSSANPAWQESLVSRIAGGPAPQTQAKPEAPQRQFAFWSRWVFTSAAVALATAAGWWGWFWFRTPPVDALLAQAYTERRTIEVRIAGAKYAPMRVERGANGSNLDKPAALLKAEALISENLSKSPTDPVWLQAKARADLLDGNYDSAIQSLRRALEEKPDSSPLLTDLASAYFERGKVASRPVDYGDAIQLLGRALAQSPDDRTALFNHALVCEQMLLYNQAIEDWQRYLRIDPTGEWADAARNRLAALKEKVQLHEKNQRERLLTPAEIVGLLGSRGANPSSILDERAEDYLDEAITQWLPDALAAETSHSSPNSQSETQGALNLLARVLATRHGDLWLRDLLDAPVSASLSTGVRYLSRAATEDAQGDPDAALLDARLAKQSFERARSRPAELRALFEEIYALHRQYHRDQCLAVIGKMDEWLARRRYSWIKIQTDLEHYACLGDEETQLDSAMRLLTGAREEAMEAKYATLYLRALALTGSAETASGSTDRAWEWDRAGLQMYWSGNYPPVRAQHFYDDLSINAQDSAKWLLAVVLGREAVSAIAATPSRTGEGMERIRLAQSAGYAQFWQEASQQYAQALAAFSSIPQNQSNRAFHAYAEIGLAEAALNERHVQDAEVHISYARANLPSDFEETQTWLSLYQNSAELSLQRGDTAGAEVACTAAVLVAEVDLRGVHTDIEKLRWNRAAARCYRTLVAFRLRDGDGASALKLWEWYQSASIRPPLSTQLSRSSLADLDRSPALPALNDALAQLPSLNRETLISYAELGNQVGAWVYDDRGTHWQALDVAPTVLNVLATRFSEECSDPQSDRNMLRANGRKLYDLVFAPLLKHLDPSRGLLIETSDGTAAIPFAALVEPSGSYLVNHFHLAYLPSLGYLDHLRPASPIARESKALIVGPPTLAVRDQAFYPPLPDSGKEAQNVADSFNHSVRLMENQATMTSVIRSLRDAEIFHFIGHTQSQVGGSRLMLAPETPDISSVLTSENIVSNAFPNLRLVVLSACSTGRGVADAADASNTLAYAFLRDGVPNVVATRWRVDSTATAVLMRFFYQSVLGGKGIPDALANAINQLRVSPLYSHPYYWAAFDAFGRAASQ